MGSENIKFHTTSKITKYSNRHFYNIKKPYAIDVYDRNNITTYGASYILNSLLGEDTIINVENRTVTLRALSRTDLFLAVGDSTSIQRVNVTPLNTLVSIERGSNFLFMRVNDPENISIKNRSLEAEFNFEEGCATFLWKEWGLFGGNLNYPDSTTVLRTWIRPSGSTFSSNWLTLTEGGDGPALTPITTEVYEVESEGLYQGKRYIWDGDSSYHEFTVQFITDGHWERDETGVQHPCFPIFDSDFVPGTGLDIHPESGVDYEPNSIQFNRDFVNNGIFCINRRETSEYSYKNPDEIWIVNIELYVE